MDMMQVQAKTFLSAGILGVKTGVKVGILGFLMMKREIKGMMGCVGF